MTSGPLRQDLVDRVLSLPVAAALGLKFDQLGDGRAVARLPWRPELSHVPGAFQANPIAALADFTGASAAMSVLSPDGLVATADYTAKFLAEARGEELIAYGRVLRPGTTLTVSAVDVFVITGGSKTLCAFALVTVRNIVTRNPTAAGRAAPQER